MLRAWSSSAFVVCIAVFLGLSRGTIIFQLVYRGLATHQKESEIALAVLVRHARTAYDKCIHVMRLHMSGQDVLDFLTINGSPARLKKVAYC
jgi:hypothetical protein